MTHLRGAVKTKKKKSNEKPIRKTEKYLSASSEIYQVTKTTGNKSSKKLIKEVKILFSMHIIIYPNDHNFIRATP